MLIPKSVLSKIMFYLFVFSVFLSKINANQPELDDVRHQLWLSGAKVLNASYTWQDAVAFINQDPNASRQWASDTTPEAYCTLVHKASWGRIWTLSFFYSLNALFIRDVVIPTFTENDYVLIPFWGEVPEPGVIRDVVRNARFPDNICFLGNSDECTEILRAGGLHAFTVSHNAFISPDLFRPVHTGRIHKAVFLGDTRPQKRLHLANSVLSNLLVVTNSDAETRKVVSGAGRIVCNPPQHEIAHYVNFAHCGLLLSASEGGCYASTEYLYCGIPVVSTKSIGGRDAYYDDVTAIVVNDTPEDVRRGVEIMCSRRTDPWEVRRRALAVSDKMLNTLAYDILRPIFIRYGDAHAANPRAFVNAKINQSQNQGSKGRTVFQPENPTHNRIEKIRAEISGL